MLLLGDVSFSLCATVFISDSPCRSIRAALFFFFVSMLSLGFLCVSLQELLLEYEDVDVDEGGLVNQCSPLLLFLFLLVGETTGGGFETLRGDKTHCFISTTRSLQ